MFEFRADRGSRLLNNHQRLVLYGFGGVGIEALDLAQQLPEERRFNEVVIMDDAPGAAPGEPRVVSIKGLRPDDAVCVTVADCGVRQTMAKRCGERVFASLIAESAKISRSASVGAGAVVFDHCLINAHAEIGSHFICLYYSHVSHDCRVGNFVTFGPRVSCCGNVQIGDSVFIGAGATIRNGNRDRPLRIGARALIGMGAVVISDVPDDAVLIGNPARQRKGV